MQQSFFFFSSGWRATYFSMRSNVTPGTNLALFCIQNLKDKKRKHGRAADNRYKTNKRCSHTRQSNKNIWLLHSRFYDLRERRSWKNEKWELRRLQPLSVWKRGLLAASYFWEVGCPAAPHTPAERRECERTNRKHWRPVTMCARWRVVGWSWCKHHQTTVLVTSDHKGSLTSMKLKARFMVTPLLLVEGETKTMRLKGLTEQLKHRSSLWVKSSTWL